MLDFQISNHPILQVFQHKPSFNCTHVLTAPNLRTKHSSNTGSPRHMHGDGQRPTLHGRVRQWKALTFQHEGHVAGFTSVASRRAAYAPHGAVERVPKVRPNGGGARTWIRSGKGMHSLKSSMEVEKKAPDFGTFRTIFQWLS